MSGKIKSDNLTPHLNKYSTRIMKNMKANYAALDSVSVINKNKWSVNKQSGRNELENP